jgi:hypothetical protein
LEFTGLERTVFAQMCDAEPGVAEWLGALLATARLTERDNTGHGFYTTFEVERVLPPVAMQMVDAPNAEIGVGDEVLIMGFVLWLKDGHPDCLEGFQYGTLAGDDLDLKATGLDDLVWLRAAL